MKAFHTIAIPHDDILSGKLTMDVFAADLWEVYQGRAPEEYADPERFFMKTYETVGLRHLLQEVEKRLAGGGGDPVIRVQTPFGGGKTHTLIAMFHRAEEWGAERAVIVGTALDAHDTLWGVLAEQLTGSRKGFEGLTAPGRDALQKLLGEHQPVLILMDEVLEYVTKAAGVQVGDSTLAAQTMAFMQELTETLPMLERCSLVVTLPSSLLEHYDERSERLFQQLQKISGRIERVQTPVQDEEISRVIRQRLFARVDVPAMRRFLTQFMKYAEKDGLIPAGMEPGDYRQRFEASYPFLPEVIDVLYQRWGSFPAFQRTRGVLRLLSMVVYAHRESRLPYLTLADFDLGVSDIRRELLKFTGPEFESVIASDITGPTAGARKVDAELGAAYKGLRLGTRTATTIFMYSFSGGPDRGATLGEIKRHATTMDNPATAVAEALERLKPGLFYIQTTGSKVYFTSTPNLNRVRQLRMEAVRDEEIEKEERKAIQARIEGEHFQVYIWPESDSDIPDSPELKLLIMRQDDHALMRQMLENKGTSPRVHRNTLIFLAPQATERQGLEMLIRGLLADRSILQDSTLSLRDDQAKEVRGRCRSEEKDLAGQLRRVYRILYLPDLSDFRRLDLGVPTYGVDKKIDEEVYEKLKLENEILQRVEPLLIKEKYLRDREYVYTRQIMENWSRTPGELRVPDVEAWRRGIAEGVARGLFGVGEVENDAPRCRWFREKPSIAFADSEVIIREDLCSQQLALQGETKSQPEMGVREQALGIWDDKKGKPDTPIRETEKSYRTVRLHLIVPPGKVSNVLGVLRFLQEKFAYMELTVHVTQGSISEEDYEMKIRETFRQMGVDVGEQFES